MRLLAFDLECSGLNADFGIVLCCGFGDVGQGKPKVLNILDCQGKDLIAKERNLLKLISERMLEADVWLGHYACYFDIPFLNSRLLYHRLPVLPANHALIDTWRVARNRLKLRSNRLATVSEFLGTKDEKNAIKPEQWIRAMGGHRPSMAYICEHCRLDILVLEEAYHRLRPLVLDHPNKGLISGGGGCGTCGSHKLQRRGWYVTRTKRFQRLQCTSCGSWSRETKPSAKLT